jgi:hypothetical protein
MPVPSLEATHAWTPYGPSQEPATPVPPVLNRQDVVPRVKIDKITGWYSLPEADDNRTTKNGRDGEIVLPSAELGKTIVYEGRAQAYTLADLETVVEDLRAGFRNRYREGVMTVTAGSGWGGQSWFYRARVMQLDCDADLDYVPNRPFPFQLGYQLGLRMGDARFYATGQRSASGAAGATVVVNVGGKAPTLPVFTITPTATTVTLLNTSVATSNGTAEIHLTGVAVGTPLIVDFNARGIIGLDGTRYDELFAPETSDWWDELIPGLIPGNNSIRVDGASWTMTWYDATP